MFVTLELRKWRIPSSFVFLNLSVALVSFLSLFFFFYKKIIIYQWLGPQLGSKAIVSAPVIVSNVI